MEFLGDCRNMEHIMDATEMAQLIERSEPLTAGKVGDVYWIYDDQEDIHYFFRRDISNLEIK
jgi:hypothetical protein